MPDDSDLDILRKLTVPYDAPKASGRMYLHLYHGRNTPGENLPDWGFEGPTFGPIDYFHITYLSTFRIGTDDGDNDAELHMVEDLWEHDGKYYGDLDVYVAS